MEESPVKSSMACTSGKIWTPTVIRPTPTAVRDLASDAGGISRATLEAQGFDWSTLSLAAVSPTGEWTLRDDEPQP